MAAPGEVAAPGKDVAEPPADASPQAAAAVLRRYFALAKAVQINTPLEGEPLDDEGDVIIAIAKGVGRRVMLASYERRYRQLRAVDEANIEPWTFVFLAQRLSDNIPEERERLLRLLSRRMTGG